MTPDMRTVRVFVQLEGDEDARDRAMAGLKAASGFVRHQLTERLHLRRSPEVMFIPDTSEEYGHRIDALLNKLKEQ
jgi:ribosome-binding factor A